MMFPKPEHKKKNKALNNPVPTENDTCWICQKPYAQTHEIFYGNGKRQLSIKYGQQVKLCNEHHRQVHKNPNQGLDKELKQMAQKNFEAFHGHKKYMELFTINYLDQGGAA